MSKRKIRRKRRRSNRRKRRRKRRINGKGAGPVGGIRLVTDSQNWWRKTFKRNRNEDREEAVKRGMKIETSKKSGD